ncbi:MAG: ABC transporter permease [Candidatus Heimdallarchaeota archaeon]|nr:ABC transporter permease [Candidatus Heimdallarchaeota archaeon]
MEFFDQLISALRLVLTSADIWSIVALSLYVSITAVTISAIIGIPIGLYWGLRTKKDRVLSITLLNTAMGLPPVFVGLIVFLLISRSGPLGLLSILFTPTAMVAAQTFLTLPIIIGITRSTIKNLPADLRETLVSLGANKRQEIRLIFTESKSGISVAVILALGRAFSEVGAIFIVGGNIKNHTRVLTTAIITEISKGENELALALGIFLLAISFTLTSFLTLFQLKSQNLNI